MQFAIFMLHYREWQPKQLPDDNLATLPQPQAQPYSASNFITGYLRFRQRLLQKAASIPFFPIVVHAFLPNVWLLTWHSLVAWVSERPQPGTNPVAHSINTMDHIHREVPAGTPFPTQAKLRRQRCRTQHGHIITHDAVHMMSYDHPHAIYSHTRATTPLAVYHQRPCPLLRPCR
jgi:hypothetical protein